MKARRSVREKIVKAKFQGLKYQGGESERHVAAFIFDALGDPAHSLRWKNGRALSENCGAQLAGVDDVNGPLPFSVNVPPRKDEQRLHLYGFSLRFAQMIREPIGIALGLLEGGLIPATGKMDAGSVKDEFVSLGPLQAAFLAAGFCFKREHPGRSDDDMVDVPVFPGGKIVQP